MDRKEQMEVEALAAKILKTYFSDADVEFAISTFAEDIVWIGGGQSQRAEGKSEVSVQFRAGRKRMAENKISEEEYHVMDLGNGCFLCTAISRLVSAKTSDLNIDTRQRCTFIFRKKEKAWETVHIHWSIPYIGAEDDSFLSEEPNQERYERLQSALLAKNQEYNNQILFLERLFDTLPCGILQFSTDPNHTVIAVNAMNWKFYGYNSEEEYRADIESPLKTVRPEDNDWITAIIDGLELNGESVSYRRKCNKKTGEEAWINVVMGREVNHKGQEVIQALFTDITEQVQLEEEQRQERAMESRSLRTAICTTYPVIVHVNLTQDTYKFYLRTEKMKKLPDEGKYSDMLEDCIQRAYPSYREDFAAKFNKEEILRRFSDGEREIYMELQQTWNDEKYHWMSQQLIYIENPFNNDVMAIEMIKFLDDQRAESAKQEQLLRDALAAAKAANHAKSDFLSRMSHDIRTPMNAIIGMSSIGLMKAEDSQAVKECFKKIEFSSQYLLSLINDILDMTRIEANKMEITDEIFDIDALMNEVNQIIFPQAAEKGLAFHINMNEKVEKNYIGDALRIKQVLLNLLSNALKFTPEGGNVGINVRERERKNGYAYLELQVKDNGIGMSKEFMKKIFNPFEQEAPGSARDNVGSGLGLAIVYNLVQLMGGTVQVESKKHRGSRFVIQIPLQLVDDGINVKHPDFSAQEIVLHTDENKAETPKLQGLRVLLAEDNELNREIAVEILSMEGAEVDVAENGCQAVDLFAQQEEGIYDVVLMDIRMPIMNGIEATKAIRAMNRKDASSIPIIAMTANAFSEDKQIAFEAEMTGYMIKPLNIEKLITEMETYKKKR